MSAIGLSFDDHVRGTMRVLAERKAAENEASDAIDQLPHDVYALACMRNAAREDRAKTLDREALQLAYEKTLWQLGLRLEADGRMAALPPAPCGHRPGERNMRDTLQCDGCRGVP